MCTKILIKPKQFCSKIIHCNTQYQHIMLLSKAVKLKCPTIQINETSAEYHFNGALFHDNNKNYITVESNTKRFYCNAKEKQQIEDTQQHTKVGLLAKMETNDIEEMHAEINYKAKYILYAEFDDIMHALISCTSFEKFKDMVQEWHNEFKKEHIVQSIVLTWMLQMPQSDEATVYVKNDSNSDLLNHLLLMLHNFTSDLNMYERSCCLLYLRKMDVPVTHSIVKTLLQDSLSVINSSTEIIPLEILSRVVIAMKIGGEFFMPITCANFCKHINKHIHNFRTFEDAHLLAICMRNLQPLIDTNMLNVYKKQLNELIDSKVVSPGSSQIITSILNMLNMAVWSQYNTICIRKLLVTLQPRIGELKDKDIKSICRIYHYHKEPASLHQPLHEAIQRLYDTNTNVEALACLTLFNDPKNRYKLVKSLKQLIVNSEYWQEMNSSLNFFTALRALKITDNQICDAYWNGVLNRINNCPEEEFNHLKFLQHCHRYMYFNNNMGGTYRHLAFEKRLCQEAIRIIEYEIEGRIPRIFARLAAFVLAYGHTPYSWKKYPNILLSKIINMADQFTPNDCAILSRGLHISLAMRYRFEVPPLVCMQLATIDTILSCCAEKYLTTSDNQCSVNDLNIILKSLSYRKPLSNSVIYHKILSRYTDINFNDLNSRYIRDITYNLTFANQVHPDIFCMMFQYIKQNFEYVTIDTLEKLLTCAYNLGYVPENNDVLHNCGLILKRDFNHASSLVLVQACLALCFYKAVPEDLIDQIFCAKFIHRTENEIQQCYSKATYPERILNIIMQLNRSVCLDYPQCNVPWFQQSFIEAQISKQSSMFKSRFQHDVKRFLTEILKDESYFRCNHITPYGYQIDFVIHFDKNRELLKTTPVETTMLDRITKIAILLLKLDSFSTNDLQTLRGPQSLKIKHLEMMGYKVLHINEHDWYSKYMKKPKAKENYLRCLLQITN